MGESSANNDKRKGIKISIFTKREVTDLKGLGWGDIFATNESGSKQRKQLPSLCVGNRSTV